MIKAFLLAGLAAAALQDDPVAAEALKGYRHPWADFKEGASVTFKETLRRPAIDDKGQLVYRDVVAEVVWTVVEVTSGKTSIKIESGGQESVIPHFIGLPNWSRGKGEKKGPEELTIGGRMVKCEVTTLSLDVEKDAGQRTTIWKSPEVPYWAARRRVETLIQGKTNTAEDEVVLAVGQKVKAGETEVSCVLVQVTIEAGTGVTTVRKEWRSDEVPGRVVKSESRQYVRGKESESSLTQMEVVSFRAKR